MKLKTKLPTFNSPLETGVRSLAILVADYPSAIDLQRLLELDYLVVHSGDAGGPESLHAPLPLRAGELLVRRGLVEKGLNLMISRGLVSRMSGSDGFTYKAAESAAPFLALLSSDYSRRLIDRAKWATQKFKNHTSEDIRKVTSQLFELWSSQFQPSQTSES